MMTFDEFLETAKDRVREAVPGAEVKTRKVDKLQGGSYTGISVRPEGSAAAVTFNIAPAFEKYMEDESLKDAILGKIAQEAGQAASTIPDFSLADITDYTAARERLTMQMVPVGPNAEMLESIPHRTVGDIAAVYRVELPDAPESSASTLVTNELLAGYGVSAEQLHADAVAAQAANHPPVLRNMSEVLAEMSAGLFELPESPMWVASAEGGMNGACVTQIPAFLEEAAGRLGGDFFILPSSVHEVLFIRDDGSFELDQLEGMVSQVNENVVDRADFLSDSVYHYDSEAHIFEKAADFEQRVFRDPELNGAAPGKETMTVLLVEPDRHPRPVEIGTELEDLQAAVGGFIEAVYPFDEPVGLITNEEGKLDGLPLNRALRDDDGRIYDVIAGPFLVVGLTGDSFGSLTPEQMSAFEEKFHSPEVFVRMGHGILAIPVEEKAAEAGGQEIMRQKHVKEEVR